MQLAYYDTPEPGWVAFIRQERIPGRFDTPDEAKTAAEEALQKPR